jgi:hypothetical protein
MSRKPEVLADASYYILSKPAKGLHGQLFY